MVFVFCVLCVVFALVFSFNLCTRKYTNYWKLSMIFGKKGAGKSTYLTKLAIQHLAKGWTVYSTIPIPFCYEFNPSDLGIYATPANLLNPLSDGKFDYSLFENKVSRKVKKLFDKISKVRPNGNVLILVDEVGMIWDNRNFKSFAESTRDWFKLQRHYKCKVFLFSQSFDVDKKIRDLCDDMYLIQNKFKVFSYGKHIIRKLDIVEGTAEAESRIVDQLKFDLIFFFFLGSRTLTFIPRWASLFDSFVVPELESKEYSLNFPSFWVASLPAVDGEE